MGGGAAGGPVTSPKWSPSWILPRIRNQVKTAKMVIFFALGKKNNTK